MRIKVLAEHGELAATHPREYVRYRKYKDRSMVDRRRFVDTLVLVRGLDVDGAIVECGSWHCGMLAALAEALPGRDVFALDSFQGLPDPGEHDSDRDRVLVDKDRLIAAEAIGRDTLARQPGAFQVVPGWFVDTVPTLAVEQIAVLRLDADLYESTMVCLEHLFPKVAPGGLVLIDDYEFLDGCTRAVHDYLSRHRRTEAIQRIGRSMTTWLVKC
jgi:hypothetical protein